MTESAPVRRVAVTLIRSARENVAEAVRALERIHDLDAAVLSLRMTTAGAIAALRTIAEDLAGEQPTRAESLAGLSKHFPD